jgi:hypothetical protein
MVFLQGNCLLEIHPKANRYATSLARFGAYHQRGENAKYDLDMKSFWGLDKSGIIAASETRLFIAPCQVNQFLPEYLVHKGLTR